MKKQRLMSIILACVLLISGCSSGASSGNGAAGESRQTNCYTNLYEADEQELEIKKAMEKEELSNVVEFFKWVNQFNQAVGGNAGLKGEWTPINEIDYKEDVIASNWTEKNEGEIDANCRIAAFLLLKDKIKTDGLDDYGSYLMMDIDELETNSRYRMISKSIADYTALFNEVSVSDAKVGADYEKAFPDAWKERGVKFPKGNVSLVSVIMNDPYDKLLFIGHCGVLLKQDDGTYYFIEKMSPSMPYQFFKFDSKKQLSQMLLGRQQYTAGDEDYHTFLLENDKVMEE